jgi:hypothetical protein
VKTYLKNETMTDTEAEKMVVGEWKFLGKDGYTCSETYSADHTVKSSNGSSGKWEIKNGEWRSKWQNGDLYVAKLPLKSDVESVCLSPKGVEKFRATRTKLSK